MDSMLPIQSRTPTMGDRGTFRTTILIESTERRGDMRSIDGALVDTGSEYTWVPADVLASLGIRPEHTQRFIVADGRHLERPVGIAIVHAAGAKRPTSSSSQNLAI
jgi:predicted aspartyl protease